MNVQSDNDGAPVFSVLLAGGSGQRMKPFIQRWLGSEVPKQYCCFTGRHSMLEHTWKRAEALTTASSTITVVASGHEEYLAQLPRSYGSVLAQPCDAGTAPGIFLALAKVMARDHSAVVHVMPCDHFLFPNERFAQLQAEATAFLGRHRDRLVLFAAPADRAEPEYGWIEPDRQTGDEWPTVRSFHEKPSAAVARDYFERGYLWNTMIMAVRAETLWALGTTLHPRMMIGFERLREAFAAQAVTTELLNDVYGEMPVVDFSRDIAEQAVELTVVRALDGVLWSDWGQPQRVLDTLWAFGMAPAFPRDVLEPDVGRRAAFAA